MVGVTQISAQVIRCRSTMSGLRVEQDDYLSISTCNDLTGPIKRDGFGYNRVREIRVESDSAHIISFLVEIWPNQNTKEKF